MRYLCVYDLFWNANVYGFGNIVSENDVDCGTFDRGEEVVLTAVPAGDNYEFVRWSDDPHFDGDHRDFDVYEDLDLVVYMEEIEPDDD